MEQEKILLYMVAVIFGITVGRLFGEIISATVTGIQLLKEKHKNKQRKDATKE